MSEEAVRAAVATRSGGRCEASGWMRAEEMSHRIGRGRGGPWTVANVLHLSGHVHRLCHAHPDRAYQLGWFVRTGADPASSPVWLALPFKGWWLITEPDDGGPHVLVPVYEDDLHRLAPAQFTDPRTGEIRIPAPPRLPVPKPFGANRKGTITHAQHH